jgi:elongation factor G
MGVRQALRLAKPALLEPIMRASIQVTEPYLGTVMADFSRRRGSIHDIHIHQNLRTIVGDVPLAEVRGYVTSIRDMTSGRGTFTLEFRQYKIIPDQLAESIIEERQARGKIIRR